ncbi:hypothetical protein ACLMJK_008379 [Lecanora helva]
MAPLNVPETGMTLVDSPRATPADQGTGNKPLQIMQVDLTDDVLEDIVKSARHGGTGLNVSFGKTIAIHYGHNKSQHLTASSSSSPSSLYDHSTNNAADLTLAGRLSHKLTIQKAKEDIAGADEALAKLQSQLASHEKAKQSMQIKFVPDSSKLPPPMKQTAAALKQQSYKTKSTSFLKKSSNNRLYLQHDTTRSMPASPSLGPRAALDQKMTLTPAPDLPNADAKTARLKAIRIPLIHYLAARPASAKLLSQTLECKQDEILEVLQKVGKPYRLDDSKWDLTDKAFKELDVWSFDYPNQEDRGLAINRAVSAFDRMRLSTQEKLWDKLLPKAERGKGKILSQLNLHKGPIQKPATPKIHVEHSSSHPKVPKVTSDESDQKDRLAPSDAEPMARSKSHGPIKKTKISEKEAQSKRLLSKGPKKTAAEPKPKEAHPAVKKGGSQKKSAPKSSEFVNDSDEEDGLDDAVAKPSQPVEPSKNESNKDSLKSAGSQSVMSIPKVNEDTKAIKSVERSKPSAAVKPNGITTPEKARNNIESESKPVAKEIKNDTKVPALPKPAQKKPLPSGASSPGVKSKLSEASPSSTAMKKSLSRQRTTSSPHKPSPLGSSPPTNASDLDIAGNSSSSSPPLSTLAGRSSATPNGVGLGINGHARQNSDRSSKRKANELGSDIHNHSSPLANGVTKGFVNGYMTGCINGAKRQKVCERSPNSDSSDELLTRDVALKKAQDFKKYYANYEKQYREISQMDNAPQEKVDELMRMHRRLAELKDQITRGLAGI